MYVFLIEFLELENTRGKGHCYWSSLRIMRSPAELPKWWFSVDKTGKDK